MDENKEVCATNEKECKCKTKLKCVITFLTFIFALTSMCYSILLNYKMNVLFDSANIKMPKIGGEKKGTISQLYDKGQSFDKAKEQDKAILAFFYVDWCGYCQRFAPTFNKLSKDKSIKENLAIAYINCEDEKNAEIVQEYGIQGFPSVFVVKGDKKEQIPNNLLYGDEKELKELLIDKAK